MTYRTTLWAIEWRSVTRLDSDRRHFVQTPDGPLLFSTRAKARAFVEQTYSYIRTRPDLRAEPHGWHMPRAVRVAVTLRAAA